MFGIHEESRKYEYRANSLILDSVNRYKYNINTIGHKPYE